MNRGNESTCLPNRQMSEEADDFIGNRAKQLARRLADSVDVKLKVQVPMETLIKMALVACAADFFTFENIIDTSEDERKALFARLPSGRARALRMLIAAEKPKTQMSKPTKAQFPDVSIGETVRRRPILNNIGAELMPTQ